MAGGLQIAHIPYKGTAPALTDLLGGQVDMMCDNLGVSLPHVRSGKLKALAVASTSALSPRCPTCRRSPRRCRDSSRSAWFGIVGAAEDAARHRREGRGRREEALKQPDVQKRLADLSAEPMGLTPAETAAFMRRRPSAGRR